MPSRANRNVSVNKYLFDLRLLATVRSTRTVQVLVLVVLEQYCTRNPFTSTLPGRVVILRQINTIPNILILRLRHLYLYL